ncbi:MAG: hypothetical protein R3E97_13540 [Candidatus Eisenbacteria bacterium]
MGRLVLHRLLVPLGLLFGSLLFCLGLAEVLLRILDPSFVPSAGGERHYFCGFDERLGWAPLPNVDGRHERHGFSVLVHQNEFGLRAPDGLSVGRNDPELRRVVVLGDSYVGGYGVEQDEMFTAPEVQGPAAELLNLGVSGYGTDQECLLYESLGTRFEVDEVALVITPYNDIENNLASRQYGYAKPYFTEGGQGLILHQDHIREDLSRSFIHGLRTTSRAINFIDHASRTIRNVKLRQKPHGAAVARNRVIRETDVKPEDRAGVDLTLGIVERLRDQVTSRGAEFIVVFVPFKPHVVAGESRNHPLVPLLAEGLAAAGIDYLEPYALFLSSQTEDASLFNQIDNHFSARGHELFARLWSDPVLRERTQNAYTR